jgi:hypothetical protein
LKAGGSGVRPLGVFEVRAAVTGYNSFASGTTGKGYFE